MVEVELVRCIMNDNKERSLLDLSSADEVKTEIEKFAENYKNKHKGKSDETYRKQYEELNKLIGEKKLEECKQEDIVYALKKINTYYSTRASNKDIETLASIIKDAIKNNNDKCLNKEEDVVLIVQEVIDKNKEATKGDKEKGKFHYSLITKFFSTYFKKNEKIKQLPIMDSFVRKNLLGLDGNYRQFYLLMKLVIDRLDIDFATLDEYLWKKGKAEDSKKEVKNGN